MKPLLRMIAVCWMISAVFGAEFQMPAVLADGTGARKEIRLLSFAKGGFRYTLAERPDDVMVGKIPDDGTILFEEPAEFAVAMDLYQARRYDEARAKFAGIREHYQPVRGLRDNPSSLAGFYELECLRRTGDLDGLAAALQTYSKEALTRESQLRQLELYLLWDSVRTKSWDRLEKLAAERAETRLPGDQRAQVAWCHGLALEGLGRPDEARGFYQIAITADAGASVEIARQAALRILAIHRADPGVQAVLKTPKRDHAPVDPKVSRDLREAAALARLYQSSLGAGSPLPTEYRVFLESPDER